MDGSTIPSIHSRDWYAAPDSHRDRPWSTSALSLHRKDPKPDRRRHHQGAVPIRVGRVDRTVNGAKCMRADPSTPIATKLTRRRLMTAAAGGASTLIGAHLACSQGSGLRFDFTKPLDGWTTVSGKWAIEDVAGASQGGRALVQRATDNDFNVIVAPGGPYGNVDVSVRFKP